MDSIIEYLPIYKVKGKEPINYKKLGLTQIHDNSLLMGYPRLMKALNVKKSYDLDAVYDRQNNKYRKERKELITEIVGNLDIRVKKKHFKSALLV